VEKLLEARGFSKKAFLSWAKKKQVVETDKNGDLKVQKIDGHPVRAVAIKLDNGIASDEDGFMAIDDQMQLPFE
jgi:hypothetical protein